MKALVQDRRFPKNYCAEPFRVFGFGQKFGSCKLCSTTLASGSAFWVGSYNWIRRENLLSDYYVISFGWHNPLKTYYLLKITKLSIFLEHGKLKHVFEMFEAKLRFPDKWGRLRGDIDMLNLNCKSDIVKS